MLPPINAPKERTIGIVQFIGIIVLAVLVVLGWDFGRRILDTMRLLDLDEQATAKVQALEQENSELKQLKQDVSSDDWVEYECRVLLRCARDNETIFVPIATPVPATPPAPVPTPQPQAPKPFWRAWLDGITDAIFGPPP